LGQVLVQWPGEDGEDVVVYLPSLFQILAGSIYLDPAGEVGTVTKRQTGEGPTYVLSYPRPVRLARFAAVILLAGGAIATWILAWVRFVSPLVRAVQAAGPSSAWGRVLIESALAQPLRPLLAAHLGLLLTAGSLAFVYALLPDLALADEGLLARTLRGWRLIPWNTVQAVRIMSFTQEGRRLVLLQGHWSRWSPWPRLVSLVLGAGFDPGLLFTSALRDFKPLMVRLYRDVHQAVPDALFDDRFFSPAAALLAEPLPTLADLADQARDEGWPLDLAAQVMGAVPAGLIVVQLLILLLQGSTWWKPLAILFLCAIEWLTGALYLYALAEIFPGSVEFREAALLYPLPQIPRALLALPMAMLIGAGLFFPAALLGLVGVLWAVMLTALLVQQMYRLKSLLPTVLGGTLQAVYLFIVLALALTA
jgi:hypothetical protein